MSEAAQYSGGALPDELQEVHWEVYLQRFDGKQLRAFPKAAILEWAFFVSLNGLGWFRLTISLDGLREMGYGNALDLPLHSMIEFKRKRGKVRNFSFYKTDFKRTENLYTAKGYGLNWLLQGRETAAYYAGTSYTVKSGALDDSMKAVVRENCYTGAVNRDTGDPDPARDYSQIIGFSVAEDVSAAATATLNCADDNVYDVLVKMANISAQQGTRLFFQVEREAETTFIFRTYTDVYGLDRTGKRTFGTANGSMRDTSYEVKHGSERTYLYVLGQGQGALRNIEEVSNSDGLNASPLNRREGAYNANQTAAANLASVGYQQLERNRPLKLFDGELIDSEESRYADHWDLGDLADVKDGEYEAKIMITGIEFSVSGGGKEQIKGTFEEIKSAT